LKRRKKNIAVHAFTYLIATKAKATNKIRKKVDVKRSNKKKRKKKGRKVG